LGDRGDISLSAIASHGLGEDLLVMAWSLKVDSLIAEVSQALQQRGVPNLVLKGPTFHSWLYSSGKGRSYGDCDLLVAPSQWLRAQALLDDLGFQDASGNFGHPNMESITSHPWMRGDDEVDLHATLAGLSADPEVVWRTLSSTAEFQAIAGVPLMVLNERARALHVCLHAAHHGPLVAKTIEDLHRAVDVLPRERWAEVAKLAEALDGSSAFASGLRLHSDGDEILAELGLAEVVDVKASLSVTYVPLAKGFNHLYQLPGFRSRLRYLIGELFPRAAFMRWWTPVARRGKRGLLAAYLWRWLYLFVRAPAGYRAYRRAARTAGAGNGNSGQDQAASKTSL
jgi:hypothetical protein